MGELLALPNVGKVLEKSLNESGIYTVQQLKVAGSKEAFIRIRLIDSGACLHMLYGLQGAIDGIKDSELPEEMKLNLKSFFKSL